MKNVELKLNLKFSEKIRTDEEIEAIMSNVLNSLIHSVNTVGIAPDESDCYTEEIKIQNNFLNTEFSHKF